LPTGPTEKLLNWADVGENVISEIGLLRLKVIAPVESTTNPFKSGLAGGRIVWEVEETTFGSSRNFSTSVAKWNRGISISV
jgi:hypothetical protein